MKYAPAGLCYAGRTLLSPPEMGIDLSGFIEVNDVSFGYYRADGHLLLFVEHYYAKNYLDFLVAGLYSETA